MSLTNDQITAKNFKEFYEAIRPYLNGSFPTPIANKFDKANMYSTDEQIVGRWIDGKPLYQKTVHITNVSSDNIELMSSGIEYAKLVDVEYITSGGIIQTGNWWYSSSDYINLRIVCNEVGKITLTILQSRNPVSEVYATIQYTKTTDTAMDIGSDTDYSTTEKIIGTWIDGKPLYQKTYYFETPITVTTTLTTLATVTDLSIDKLVDSVAGIITTTGGEEWVWDCFFVKLTPDKTLLQARIPTNDALGTDHITIKYTKTTD